MTFGVQIKPIKMIATETGRYQQQVSRPLTTHIGAGAVENILTATRDFTNINAKAVRDIAGNIISHSTEVAGAVNIQSGWETRRFRFILTIEEMNPFDRRASVIRVIYGYTDDGRMANGKFAPDQQFYFNSETVIVNRVVRTPTGMVTIPNVMGSHQIINGFSSGEVQPVNQYTIRPEDVYTVVQNQRVVEQITNEQFYGQHPLASYANTGNAVSIVDHRNMLASGGEQKLARRAEHAPNVYLTEVLRGYKEGITESDNNEVSEIAGIAQSAIANPSISSNAFLATLREKLNYGFKGYVTYSELLSLWPELDHVTRCIPATGMAGAQRIMVGAGSNQPRGNGLSDVNDSQHWFGRDHATLNATLIGQVVPAIMGETMFEVISFSAFNGHGANNFIVNIAPESIRMLVDKLDASEWASKFITLLCDRVLTPMSFGNQRQFTLNVSCDIVGETIVDIALDGDPIERYVAPSFADSMTSSLVTNSNEHANHIAEELDFLVRGAAGNQSVLMGYQPQQGAEPMQQPAQAPTTETSQFL